ncbi:MAG TPA: hypothetical protein VFZ98_11990, partial [Vicinamibacterales bacterium]
WEFLILVATTRSVGVCFDLLVGRFVRPLVMLTYYVGYHVFGLWTAPYHLFAITLHALNAWLLSLVALKLDPRRRPWLAVATGLLFLAFAGHTEAVAWVAGLADVFVLFALLGTLLSLEVPGAGGVALACGFTLTALMGKESAVVVPLVALAYAIARKFPIRRVRAYFVIAVVMVGAFWVTRIYTYGNPTAAYGGLSGYGTTPFRHACAIVIRTFMPPSNRIAAAWSTGRDIPVLALALAVFLIAVARSTNRPPIVFAVVTMALTLAPAAPLSFSLWTTESERMLYIPTAFGAVVTVAVIEALVRASALRAAILVLLIGGHAALLVRLQARWRDAGEVFHGIMTTLVAAVRADDPGTPGLILLLSLPDDMHGAYVFRRGFWAALHFYAPDLAARDQSIFSIDTQTIDLPTDTVYARRLTPGRFVLDVTPHQFLSTAPPVRPFYTFVEWTQSRYTVELAPTIGKALVLYVSAARTNVLGKVTGVGAPFGIVDIPADGAACDGSLRFSGWALDDRDIPSVFVLRDRTAADPPGVGPIALGEAARAYGTRPDVASAYGGFPHTDAAGWNFEFPCATLADLPNRSARISVRATDAEGHATELGARTVHLEGIK